MHLKKLYEHNIHTKPLNSIWSPKNGQYDTKKLNVHLDQQKKDGKGEDREREEK